MTPPAPRSSFARPSPAVAWSVCAAAVLGMAVLRLVVLHDTRLPIAYGVPLVLNLWLRSRTTLWTMTASFVAIAVVKHLWVLPAAGGDPHYSARVALALTAFDTLLIAGVLHAFIGARLGAEEQNAALRAANDDLASREEEIARQNESLQSQAGELERQAEELRVSNEELARRERTLQSLLALSRALAADLPRAQTLDLACDTLSRLVLDEDPTAGVAILELDGERLVVRCARGIGAGDDADAGVPVAQSLAGLVLSHGRTGFIEDVSLRPDLRLPPAADGGPFRSVLATPLRVAGRAVGAIEVYGRRRRALADDQVAMLESVAAQTSVSLEAAELFDRVERDRRRLQTVLQTLPVGVLIADDATGARMRGNAAMAAIYRVPQDTNFAPAGAPAPGLRRAFHRDGRPLPVEDLPLLRALRTGRAVHGEEFQVTAGDQPAISVLMSAAPFFDERGAVVGGVGALMDVTAQKQLQRELDARRREAEEASVRKTRFLAAISHDIRTPANAISLLSELLRRAATNPAMAGDIPELAQELHGSAMSLVNLLGDVLDLARFDSGRVEVLETEFSLPELLNDQERRLQPLARDKGLALRVVLPDGPDPMRVRGDRIKLGRIVDNLVGNAIKFTAAGEVRVEAVRDADGTTRVRVVDTGVGIDPADQSHIFDEFFQLSNPERDRSKGTGLGLTICKRLVDAMGAGLHVESAPGAGSTFTLVLPPTASVPVA